MGQRSRSAVFVAKLASKVVIEAELKNDVAFYISTSQLQAEVNKIAMSKCPSAD